MLHPNDNALHIAIIIYGGFGDNVISSAWIKELYRRLDCIVEIDIYTLPQHYCLFLLMPYKVRMFSYDLFNIAAGYDLKLVIAHFIRINHWDPHRIIDKDKKLYDLLDKLNVFNNKYEKYLNAQPLLDGEWANLMTKLGRNRWSELNIDGAFDFDSSKGLLHLDIDKYDVLDKLNLRGKQYITMNTGYDAVVPKRHTKIWLPEYFNTLCELIKQRYPDLIIVQLGANNSLPIKNVDINCFGKLDMEESIIVLKHSLLHIDGESGLVHIRRQLHGKSIVLFGPTSMEYHKYIENINISSPFYCTNCMWMLGDWYMKCVRTGSGYPAQCMEAITPQMVMVEAEKYLDTVLSKKIEITQTVLEIYSAAGFKKYDPILTDICAVFGVEKLPISQHIYYGAARFYIYGSKHWEYPFVVDKISAYAEQKSKNTLKVADIGGGAGLLAPYLFRIGYDTTVYDLNFTWDHNGDPERTEKLRLRWAEANGLKMEYGSVFNIPAEDETFDIVTCVSVVEHIPEKICALKEMLRVLKPDGILIVTSEDIKKTLEDMQMDNVNIHAGIAVGGFVLKKEK